MLEDVSLLASIQKVLDVHSKDEAAIPLSAESFLDKLAEIAEYTRGLPDSPTKVDPEAMRKIIGERVSPDRFVTLAAEAGALLKPEGEEPAFRDVTLRDSLAARYLMRYLDRDYADRGTIRDRAVKALADIGTPAIPRLIERLGYPQGDVRLACSVALRSMGAAAVPVLKHTLAYGNEKVRRYVIEAFMAPEMSRLATDELIEILLNDSDALVRSAAGLALQKGGTQEGTEALIDALKDENSIVVMMVKEALKEIDSPVTKRALQEYESAPKRKVQGSRSKWPGEKPVQHSAKPPRIFLSYPRELGHEVGKIRKLLGNAGFDVWLDTESLLAGERWQRGLEEAIDASDFVIAFVSTHTFDGYQMEELRLASSHVPKGREEGAAFLLPCMVGRDLRRKSLPDFLRKYHMIDLTEFETGWPPLHTALSHAARRAGFLVPIYLRVESKSDLTPAAVNSMLVARKFYHRHIYDQGRPPYMDYGGLKPLQNGSLVEDLATGRIWMSGCTNPPDTLQARHELWVFPSTVKQQANAEKLGGFSDWRVPTIEEAMSLMMPHVRRGGLYIDELFSDDPYVSTCDTFMSGYGIMGWYALYGSGECQAAPNEAPAGVRLVRTARG